MLVAAAGVVAAAAVALAARGSWFTTDDHVFFAQARETPFGWRYLTEPIYDHLSPWHRLHDELVYSLAGHGWWLALAVSLAWYAACLAAFTAVVRELVGRHPAGLATCLLFALSPFFLRAAQWWALGAQALPQVCFTLLALWAALRWARLGSARWAVAAVAAYGLALLGFPKALLVPGFLVLVLYLPPGRSWRDAWRRDRWLWAGVLALSAAYLVAVSGERYYRYIGEAPAASLELWLHFLATGWTKGVVPLALDATVPRHLGAGNWAVVVVSQLALVATVAATLARRRALWALWAGAGALVLGALAMSAGARLGQFGSHFVALDPRYTLEGALALLLAGAIALAAAFPRPRPRRSGVAVLGVAVLGAGFAADAFARLERDFDGPRNRAYFERLDASLGALRARGVRPAIVESPTPDYIVPPVISEWNLLSRVLPVHDEAIRVGTGHGPPALVGPDGKVRLVRPRVEVAHRAPAPVCAGPGGPPELAVAIPRPARALHVLDLGLAPAAGWVTGTVVSRGVPGETIRGFPVAATQTYVMRVPAGASRWRAVAGIGTVRSVIVRPAPGRRLCVRRVAVLAAPLPTG